MGPPDWPVRAVAVALAIAMLGWAAGGIMSDRIRLATVAPTIQPTLEGASAAARIFGALVLLLAAGDDPRHRLRWVAAGLMTLGLGGFAFGYVPAEQGASLGVNTQMYASLVVWTVAGACFVFGLVPAVTPPRLCRATVAVAGISLAVIAGVLLLAARDTSVLPTLIAQTDVEAALLRGDVPLPGLSIWYWALSMIPLALIIAATLGSTVPGDTGQVRGWLVIAMTILVGSRVHNLLWPSAFGPILTSANTLRFAFALVVVAGGIFELRRLAAERAVLLEAERDYSRRLQDLGQVRSDFTAMAAHELGAPIAAISGWADVLASGRLSPEMRDQAIATIRTEVGLLGRLMTDVRSVISAEDDQFAARPVSVPLASLISEAVAFARVLPGDHPLTAPEEIPDHVLADPERIGQVLRNLLSNAAKYSAPGTPIEIRLTRVGTTVRIEVVDQGFGIHPDDLTRVFEKFGRGRDTTGRRIPGIGLGLYLSRQIILAHGGTLTVTSTPGEGSTFGFTLEAAR